jgi:hypothetical protein
MFFIHTEQNAKKSKHVLLFRYKNAGKHFNIKRANRSFYNVAMLKHLGTTATNQYLTREEIKIRLILIQLGKLLERI